MLAVMEKKPAGRPPVNRSQAATDSPPSLDDLGLTKDQSSRWQREAKVPEEDEPNVPDPLRPDPVA